MTALSMQLDMEGAAAGRDPAAIVHTESVTVGALAGGTKSGNPAVVILADLPDGRTVLIETTLRLFLTAADALKARYGDPR